MTLTVRQAIHPADDLNAYFGFCFICSGTMFSGRKIGLSDGQNGTMSG